MDINKKLPEIKKELIKLQKKHKCNTVRLIRYGIEFLYFKTQANGRTNVFKAGMIKKGCFVTKEI